MKVRRVVVGLDTRHRAALQAAAELAAQLEAELVGLFVEDMDLLDFAALPFAREVGFPSATPRQVDRKAMERSLRARASELRRACAEALERASVAWSFRIVRGSPAAELLAAAEDSEPALLLPPVVLADPIVIAPKGKGNSLQPVLEALEAAFGREPQLLRKAPDEATLSELLEAGHPVLLLPD